MKNKLSEKSIEALKKKAARETIWELFEKDGSIVDDYAGGNIDDAHSLGVEDGETVMARKVLKALHE